jgi:urea-proton symporter
MTQIRRADDHDLADVAGVDLEQTAGGHVETSDEFHEEQTKLLRASKISRWMTIGLTLALVIVWPFPLYGTSYVFSKPFFTGWVTVGIIWIFGSLGTVGLFPVFQGRHTLVHTAKSIYWDLSGRKHPKPVHAERVVQDEKRASSSDVPSKKDSATVDEDKL